MTNLNSIMDEYDIPENMRPSCNLLDAVKSLYPELYQKAHDIAKRFNLHKIERLDLYYNTNLHTEYTLRRKWTLFMAIREFIQNALDEQEEVGGYKSLNNVKYYIKKQYVVISDKGRGLNIRHFMLGGTEKKCWQRGYFGEGLKVASLYLLSVGGEVIIVSKDIVYIPIIVKNVMYLILGKIKTTIKGTKVFIKLPEIEQSELIGMKKRMIFQDFLQHIKIKYNIEEFKAYRRSDNCDYERECTAIVIKSKGNKKIHNRLYVGDIYVNDFDKLGYESLATYNLWYVELEPNRKIPTCIKGYDKSCLFSAIYDIIMKNPEFEEYVFNKITEVKGDIIRINNEYIEAKVICSRYVESRAYGKFLREKFKNIVWIPSLEIIKDIRYYLQGYKFLLLPNPGEYGEIVNTIPKYDEELKHIMEKDKNNMQNNIINYDNMTIREISAYTYAIGLLIDVIHKIQYSITVSSPYYNDIKHYRLYFSEIKDDILGMFVRKDKMILINKKLLKYSSYSDIDVNLLTSTIIHELSHFYGSYVYGEASDLTKQFEDALAEIGTYIMNCAVNRPYDYKIVAQTLSLSYIIQKPDNEWIAFTRYSSPKTRFLDRISNMMYGIREQMYNMPPKEYKKYKELYDSLQKMNELLKSEVLRKPLEWCINEDTILLSSLREYSNRNIEHSNRRYSVFNYDNKNTPLTHLTSEEALLPAKVLKDNLRKKFVDMLLKEIKLFTHSNGDIRKITLFYSDLYEGLIIFIIKKSEGEPTIYLVREPYFADKPIIDKLKISEVKKLAKKGKFELLIRKADYDI